MATFLNICQATHQKVRGGNAQPGTQPTAIPVPLAPPQPDQMVYDVVEAVAKVWTYLQNQHVGWKWMRRQGILTLPNGTRTMTVAVQQTLIPALDTIIPFDATGPIYCNLYDGAAAVRVDQPCFYVAYENWRGYSDRQPVWTGQPSKFTIWPDGTLEWDPTAKQTPNGGSWTLVIDYKKINQNLVAGTDVPELPAKYHDTLSWLAVEFLCAERSSMSVLLKEAKAKLYGNGWSGGLMHVLETDQLPELLVDTRYSGYT